MDYKKMYLTLFEAATKSIEILQQAQKEAENMYIEQEDTPIVRLAKKEE